MYCSGWVEGHMQVTMPQEKGGSFVLVWGAKYVCCWVLLLQSRSRCALCWTTDQIKTTQPKTRGRSRCGATAVCSENAAPLVSL